MSAKSTAQPEVQTRSNSKRTVIVIAVVFVAFMFFVVTSYYPLIFSSEKNSDTAEPMPPSTIVK